jgi:hypothetical protein
MGNVENGRVTSGIKSGRLVDDFASSGCKKKLANVGMSELEPMGHWQNRAAALSEVQSETMTK